MPTKDPRIDAYIAESRDFAQPILKYLREVVHEGCPDCDETLKWRAPAYTRKGIIAITAAFKEHCAMVLWRGSLITGEARPGAMGNLGRITSLKDLPPKKVLLGYLKKAVELDEKGVKSATSWKEKPKKAVVFPAELKKALAKNSTALAKWKDFSPSHRREYCDWISGAKQDETKARRLKAALTQISKGQPQNWKYMKR